MILEVLPGNMCTKPMQYWRSHFFAEFERTVALIVEHPGLGALWRNGKRRFILRRFPLSVIYSVRSGEVRVLAVAHHSRRPGFWRDRK